MDFGLDLANANATYGVEGIDELYSEASEDGTITVNEFIMLLKELNKQLEAKAQEGVLTEAGLVARETLNDDSNPLGFLASSETLEGGDVSLGQYIISDLDTAQQNNILEQFTENGEQLYKSWDQFLTALENGDVTETELLDAIEEVGVAFDALEENAPAGSLLLSITEQFGSWIENAQKQLAGVAEKRDVLNRISANGDAGEMLELLNAATDKDGEHYVEGIEDTVGSETIDQWQSRYDDISRDRAEAEGNLTEAEDALAKFDAENGVGESGDVSDLSPEKAAERETLVEKVDAAEAEVKEVDRREEDLVDDMQSSLNTMSAEESAEWQRLKDQLTVMAELVSAIVKAYADAAKAITRNVGQ